MFPDNEDAENNLYFNIIDTDVTELIETKMRFVNVNRNC